MNKKEINEIKKNFSEKCGFFTIGQVVQAFVDSEKNIKYKSNDLFAALPQDESELIMEILKKTLSGSFGRNLKEYAFPKDAYLEGGMQPYMYELMKSKLTDQDKVDNFLNTIVERVAYVSTYAIFSAHCTYSVLNKTKADELTDDAESEIDYNFIVTAICPVDLRFDGLIFSDEQEAIVKKTTADRIIGMPSDGFLFPIFSDRRPDINGVLVYTKNANKPNTSVVDDLLGCEFVLSYKNEKETFHAILGNVVGDELDYDLITNVNDKIAELVDKSAHETEPATIGKQELSNILWESGVSQEKLDNIPKVFESAMGDKPLTAVNLIERKTVLSAPSITVNIGKDAQDKVRCENIDGRRCLIIALDDPEVSVNGMPTNIK
ncbi:MAG: DUF4317 domain-containing protein [Ruminococcus sp.]|nr:DUF4317 domain-containing protein [Ruminococcus sp.]